MIEKEDDNYAIPVGSANSDDEYSDWREQDVRIMCLFCKHKETDINLLCQHMDCEHEFSFAEVTKNLDFYQKVKLVNYVRKQTHDRRCFGCDAELQGPEHLQRHIQETAHHKTVELSQFDLPE